MTELNAKSACDGALPITAGNCTLTELTPAAVTSIAPFAGQVSAVSSTLKAQHAIALPAVNRSTGKDGARCIWSGQGQFMLLGHEADSKVARHAALTDQSDAWAVMRLEGADTDAVLARLVPIDVRKSSFKQGHTARTLLQHMMCSLTRTGALRFDIMVMRSFADTAVHEIQIAMQSVSARHR